MANLRVKIEHCSMVFSFCRVPSLMWRTDAAAAYREKEPFRNWSDQDMDEIHISCFPQKKISRDPPIIEVWTKCFLVFFLEGCVSILNINIKVLQMTKPTSKGLESCKHQQKTATNTSRVANNNSIQALTKTHHRNSETTETSVRKTWNVTVRFKWRLRKMVTSRSPVKEGHSAFF